MEIIFTVFTLAGIVVKLWALGVIKHTWKPTRIHQLMTAFILLFLGQSTFELMLYYFSATSLSGSIALHGFYFFALLILFVLPILMAQFARYTIPAFLMVFAVLLVSATLSLLVFSDFVISGVTSTGVALTRVAGDYYWLFQLGALLSVFSSLFVLFHCRKHANGFLKVRANNLLLSFSLLAGFAVFIVIAMQVVENLNAVGFLPLLLSLFIFGVVDNLCNEEIMDYSYWLPFSKKRRQINKLVEPFLIVQSDGLDATVKKDYNTLLANYALDLFDGNQTKAAEWLNVSQSWVSRNKG